VSNIKPLNKRSFRRGKLTDLVIRDGFFELSNALNVIADQWNDSLYPLVASLPSGTRKILGRDRSTIIDPVANGLDGSQLFVDMTATPHTSGGRLHNGVRQKTIREVIDGDFFNLSERIAHTEALVENLEVAPNATAYDDTELRNWVLQLSHVPRHGLRLRAAQDHPIFPPPEGYWDQKPNRRRG